MQAPYNTQSYNRYSYVFNNPLSFTDPSGYACVGTGYSLGACNSDVEELPVTCDSACMEQHRKKHEAQQNAINQSNIAYWSASENRGEQWSYMNGAAYNIANFWGKVAFDLAAGGDGKPANNGGYFSYENWLSQQNFMTINSWDGAVWATEKSTEELRMVAGLIALSPLAAQGIGSLGVAVSGQVVRMAPYVGRLAIGKPFASIRDFGRYLVGKRYPTKTGYMGKPQPYNPATGLFTSHSANPGFVNSPIGRFGAGLAQGILESKPAGNGAPAGYGVGRAGNVGYSLGKFIGDYLL